MPQKAKYDLYIEAVSNRKIRDVFSMASLCDFQLNGTPFVTPRRENQSVYVSLSLKHIDGSLRHGIDFYTVFVLQLPIRDSLRSPITLT